MTKLLSLLLLATGLCTACSATSADTVSDSDDALKKAAGPGFDCIAEFSSAGDNISVGGHFKSANDATLYTEAAVEIDTERDGKVSGYAVKNGSVSEGGEKSSIALLKGYVKDRKLELEPSQKLDEMNCFNVTKDGSNVFAEVHLCLRKSDGTNKPKGFVVSDFNSGDSFQAVKCN